MSWLDDAEAALERGDEEAALTHLVHGWDVFRSIELAELVEGLTRRLVAARSSPPLRWPEGDEVADPVLRGWLAERLASDGTAAAYERIRRVAAWPPDPRVAAALTALVKDPPFGGVRTRPFWGRVLELLVELADPRTPPILDELGDAYARSFEGDEMGEWMRAAAARAADEIREQPTSRMAVPAEEQLRRIAARLAPTPPSPEATARAQRTEEELLREIYAHPDDDEPRAVYADWLEERGDPRGEFIALQLAAARGAGSDEATQRAAALLRTHVKEWLGPLEPAVSREGLRFERGFVVEATLRPRKALLRPIADHPAWFTLRHLSGGLEHPVLLQLRSLCDASERQVVTLCRADVPTRLETLVAGFTWPQPAYNRPPPTEGGALLELARPRSLPSLRLLQLSGFPQQREPRDYRWLWRTDVGARLDTLSAPTGPMSLGSWLEEGERLPLRALEIRTDASANRRPLGWCLTIERDAAGRFTSLRAAHGEVSSRHPETLAHALTALPPTALTRLEVSAALHPEHVDALRRAAARFTALEHLRLPDG